MVRRRIQVALSLGLALGAPVAAADDVAAVRPPATGVARLVLVVGNDRPSEPAQTPLRYADDDAARYHERFEGLADTRILLTRFDDDSRSYQVRYPQVAPPTKGALAAAVAVLRARALELRAAGRFVELVFVFAGHGGVEAGAPYLALEDGRLGPGDLEHAVLDAVPADLGHVIVDACSAAGFVEARGPMRGDRRAMPDRLMPFGGLVERHPTVGFVVTASGDGRAFEWSRFGSGVASHLVRSGLSGAADVSPPDGRVTYDELGSFLRTATAGLLAAEYRQEITVVAPRALPSAALIDLAGDGLATLLVDRPGRYFLRDADGHRILDLHAGHTAVRLALPPSSPRFELVETIERGSGCGAAHPPGVGGCVREERSAELGGTGLHVVSALAPAAPTVASRGVIEDSVFDQLLHEPHDSGALTRDAAGMARTAPPPAEAPPQLAIGLGYRGTFGPLVKELTAMHGFDVRLDLPVLPWFAVTPVAGVSRGTATPEGSVSYPVYAFELGAEAAWIATRAPAVTTLGIEARLQVIDQLPPRQADVIATAGLVGAAARVRVPVTTAFGVGAGVSGGGRVADIDGKERLRGYGAASFTLSGEL